MDSLILLNNTIDILTEINNDELGMNNLANSSINLHIN